MKRFAIIFISVIILVVVAMMAGMFILGLGSRAYDPLSPAEHAVADKYDSVFTGVILSLNPDEWADGKVYKQQYRHGIYRATFQGLAQVIDFEKLPEDTLQQVADALYKDLLPAIPNVDLYDSIHVRYETRYKTKQPGEWPSADTSYHIIMRTIGYGLR